MKLKHIALGDLKPSDLNVRKGGTGDIADLAASIAALGILQPLLVRPSEEGFEVIAGQRRLAALNQLVQSERAIEPVPCMLLEEGDDAIAIEASLAENILRLPMNEVDQYAAFAALRAKDLSIEDIASHFGVSERLVKQRLALANLDKRILKLFEEEAINADTIRALTLATKSQQKAWLKRYRDPDDYAPTGRNLREWLLGGEQIGTSVALFDVASYKGAIVTDLFGEDSYFADSTLFWSMQKEAVAGKAEEYAARGWAEVVVLDPSNYFSEYQYRKTSKKKGGRVYIAMRNSGEVEFFEGYLPEKELRAHQNKEASQTQPPKVRDAFTKAATNYIALHKHAAVRSHLVHHEGIALRLVTAHMIGASGLWNVQREAGRADKPETAKSVAGSSSSKSFDEDRRAAIQLLDGDDDEDHEHLVDHRGLSRGAHDIFLKLSKMPDHEVLKLMTIAMAETLEAGTKLIDLLGIMMKIDMSQCWEADDAFLDLITNRATLLEMLDDIASPDVANAHKDSKVKTLRGVIRQYATGEGRTKVQGWVPSQMQFSVAAPDESHEDAEQGEAQAA